jgi:hypothetical protein
LEDFFLDALIRPENAKRSLDISGFGGLTNLLASDCNFPSN